MLQGARQREAVALVGLILLAAFSGCGRKPKSEPKPPKPAWEMPPPAPQEFWEKEARHGLEPLGNPLIEKKPVDAPLPTATLILALEDRIYYVSLPSLNTWSVAQSSSGGEFYTPSATAQEDWGLVAEITGMQHASTKGIRKWNIQTGEMADAPGFFYPSPSPDGRWVVSCGLGGGLPRRQRNPLLLIEAVGEENPWEEVYPDVRPGYAQWLPDSKAFLFSAADGQVCEFDVASRKAKRLPVKGQVAVFPQGDRFAVIEDGKSLRVLTLPGLETVKEVPLRYRAEEEAAPIALDAQTVAYLAQGAASGISYRKKAVVVVGLQGEGYQAHILDIPAEVEGLWALRKVRPEPPESATDEVSIAELIARAEQRLESARTIVLTRTYRDSRGEVREVLHTYYKAPHFIYEECRGGKVNIYRGGVFIGLDVEKKRVEKRVDMSRLVSGVKASEFAMKASGLRGFKGMLQMYPWRYLGRRRETVNGRPCIRVDVEYAMPGTTEGRTSYTVRSLWFTEDSGAYIRDEARSRDSGGVAESTIEYDVPVDESLFSLPAWAR